MVKETRVVVGSYTNTEDAKTVLDRLKDAGYKREDITLYADSANVERLSETEDVDVLTDETLQASKNSQTDRSFWAEVKDMFSTDTDTEVNPQDPNYMEEDDILAPYREDIKNGQTVVVVNNYRGDVDLSTNYSDSDLGNETTAAGQKSTDNLTDDEKLRLKEERLKVDKEEVQTGEVNVQKETKHDTETVDVPVEREEVVIERKPVVGEESKVTDGEFDEESESYTIPVKEEQVKVEKEPVVTEEVEIKKKRDEDVESVTEDVKREELNVEAEGRTGAEADKKNPENRN